MQDQHISKCTKRGCGAMQFTADLNAKGQCKSHRGRITSIKQVIDGVAFDSTSEANRYLELRDLNNRKVIQNLKCHTKYKLWCFDVLIGVYTDDFSYDLNGVHVVEDVKSEYTRKDTAYQLRRKLFYANYKIEITEAGKIARKSKSSSVRTSRKKSA